jgi:hypothetical protein
MVSAARQPRRRHRIELSIVEDSLVVCGDERPVIRPDVQTDRISITVKRLENQCFRIPTKSRMTISASISATAPREYVRPAPRKINADSPDKAERRSLRDAWDAHAIETGSARRYMSAMAVATPNGRKDRLPHGIVSHPRRLVKISGKTTGTPLIAAAVPARMEKNWR